MNADDVKFFSSIGFKCYVVSSKGALMCLSPGQKLYFRGKVRFKPLKGTWVVLGARLVPSSSSLVSVYCPTGYSYLCLESTEEASISQEVEKRFLRSLNLEENEEINSFLEDSSHVAYVEALPDAPWNLFVASHIAHVRPRIHLFEKNKSSEASSPFETTLDIRIINPNSPRLFNSLEEWDFALRSVSLSRNNGVPTPKVLIAGGKGVGKSSFSKYILNGLLSHSPVYFVDLDPGQGEFDPPGFISAHLIKTPILGPNFTHMNLPASASYYVGDVNMSNCSERFLLCVSALLKDLEEHCESSYPWIINTMGFNKGLGLLFLVDIIRLFRPSTVVNILSRFPKKNYDIELSSQSISTEKGWFTKPGEALEYNLLIFPAIPESSSGGKELRAKDNWGIPEPRKLRDITLLSYLGASLFSQKDFFSRKIVSLHGLCPIKVPWKDVALQLLHVPSSETKHALDIINASLVSLGVAEDPQLISAGPFSLIPKTVVAKSLGFGFVRSVDRVKECFYLLTSLRGPALSSVNVLSCGAIFLPEDCYKGDQSEAPYVQKDTGSNPLDRPWQRHFKPSRNDQSQNFVL